MKSKIQFFLEQSFDDFRLDTQEKFEFKQLLQWVKEDSTQISFVRNRAFDIVESHFRATSKNQGYQPNHLATLKWLENVVKVIDSARIHDAVQSEVYFSPGDTCRRKIISLFNNCRSTAAICVFTISDDKITDAIKKAHDNKKSIRIITDNDKANDKGSDIYRLADHGLDIRIDKSPNHMHHKYAIFDDKTLVNGSFNWTRSASRYNQENIAVTDQQSQIKPFNKQFELLWELCEPI